MKTIRLFLIASLLMSSNYIKSQTTGIIKGTVTDEKKNPMLFLNVALLEDSTIINSTTTDEKGNYVIKDITPGNYTVQFSYTGYITKKIKEVEVDPIQIAYVNTSLKPSDNLLKAVEIFETFEKTIINPIFTTMTPIRRDQIENIPASKGDIIGLITAVTPGVLATDDGKDLYTRGSRSGTTQYIIDGNKTMDNHEVPGMGIASMEVLTGGVPAEYGDCTGGIVIINTKEYKWEMRRKEMERRARKEREEEVKEEKIRNKE